jgi:hypothetical protein
MELRPCPPPGRLARVVRGRFRVLRRRVALLRLARRFVAALAGAGIAASCPYWPEELRPACSLLVQITKVLSDEP